MSLFLDRSRRAGEHLEWKVRLFAVAAVFGLGGMYFDERWMGAVAIGLLASAMFFRFFGRGRGSGDEAGADDDLADREEPGAGEAG